MSYIKTWVERCDEHPDHQSGMVSNGMIQARMQEEIDDLREAIEKLRDDAMRYRWLRKQKTLRLVSDGTVWKRKNGDSFRASHVLSASDTRYGVYETLDETIDEAMRGELDKEEGKP